MENKMYFENAKVSEQEKVQGLFYYKVRHTDEEQETMENYTVENRVIVNRFCDLVCNFKIEELDPEVPNTDQFLTFKDFEAKYLPELVDTLEELLEEALVGKSFLTPAGEILTVCGIKNETTALVKKQDSEERLNQKISVLSRFTKLN